MIALFRKESWTGNYNTENFRGIWKDLESCLYYCCHSGEGPVVWSSRDLLDDIDGDFCTGFIVYAISGPYKRKVCEFNSREEFNKIYEEAREEAYLDRAVTMRELVEGGF
jgi:hypothetical protein